MRAPTKADGQIWIERLSQTAAWMAGEHVPVLNHAGPAASAAGAVRTSAQPGGAREARGAAPMQTGGTALGGGGEPVRVAISDIVLVGR